MQIVVPAETWPNESRVALIPDSVKKLTKAGFDVLVESQCGKASGFTDEDYVSAGAGTEADRSQLLGKGDIVLRVRKPADEDLAQYKSGAVQISYLDPYNETELVGSLASAGVTAISMEMIPRTTRRKRWMLSHPKPILPAM